MDTTTFTVRPRLAMNLFSGDPRIKRVGGWETYIDKQRREFKTLAAAKSAVRASLPEGTRIAWQRTEFGDWKGQVL